MIQKYFEKITDPRQGYKIKYNLLEVITMTICAVIAECEAWYQIVEYCEEKQDWFRSKLGLKLENAIPSHDTFERIFAMIDPKEFEKCFILWVKEVNRLTKSETVSIDGKTIRASRDSKKKALHIVSAWANDSHMVLGQVKTNEKSNEITAIPTLLDLLEVKGCIVTIDAMGCQKEIAKKVVEKEADYIFGLKGNQSTLHEDVKFYFEDYLKNQDNYLEINGKETLEKGHGRIETRQYYLSSEIDWVAQKADWAGLSSIGAVRSVVEEKGVVRTENRYFPTSLTDIDSFAKSVREHWGIENSLHWVLDVAFNEDNCRIRKDNSGENFAVIRHIALNLLKQDGSKLSLKAKRHKCAYSDIYLYKILFQKIGA
jgi:predicted transposase YbfD/YdcC